MSIRTHATATRIVFEGRRASRIDYALSDGTCRSVTARREILLSAGAIASPQLLLLSGIGPAQELAAFGIETVQNLPGVGRNLQDHVGAYLNYFVDRPTYNSEQGLHRRVWHGLNWLLFGRGPGTTPGALAMAFVRSSAAVEEPDLQLHFTPVGYKLTPDALILMEEPAVTGIPNVNQPFSRGWLELQSADFREAPEIHPRLLDDARDMDVLIRGCEMIRGIFGAPPLSAHVTGEAAPGRQVVSPSDWEAYLRSNSITIFHPCGTCKMGTDSASVVDSELRVRGTHGLRVIDASIMPHLVSGNINAPTIMIGEKGADLVLQHVTKVGALTDGDRESNHWQLGDL